MSPFRCLATNLKGNEGSMGLSLGADFNAILFRVSKSFGVKLHSSEIWYAASSNFIVFITNVIHSILERSTHFFFFLVSTLRRTFISIVYHNFCPLFPTLSLFPIIAHVFLSASIIVFLSILLMILFDGFSGLLASGRGYRRHRLIILIRSVFFIGGSQSPLQR